MDLALLLDSGRSNRLHYVCLVLVNATQREADKFETPG